MTSSNDVTPGSLLRSAQWYAGDDRNAYIHRAWMRRGVPSNAFHGRPHIAIANTASDLTPCNAHLTEVAASVKNGVYEAGGIPLELPVVSLGETLLRPTAMLWRNMAAMATEEMLRANPIDGVVLLGGCDKTIPSLLMAAASVDLPAVVVPGGPMLTGTFRGVPLGCGTDVWRLSEEVRAGTLSADQFTRSESAMIRSRGHCNTMGTASTMALVAEALGTVLPGVAGTPAADSRLLEAAHGTGRLVVEMVAADRRPSTFLTQASFANAIVTMAAVGGSTNAVVHILAIAGRLGIDLTLDDFDRIGSHGELEEVLLEFAGGPATLARSNAIGAISKIVRDPGSVESILVRLEAVSFFGFRVGEDQIVYPDVGPERKRDEVLARKFAGKRGKDLELVVHPAYRPYLQINDDSEHASWR
jgi:dihydroxyacid dehydratase/phosphogluconate dehydratase